MTSLPPYITREEVGARLPVIFTDGTPNRGYCTRELAASTIFTMLYIGAVEGSGIYMGPKHVYRMTREQAAFTGPTERIRYRENALKSGHQAEGKRWYADNTREPIRDETLREGLMRVGAVISDDRIPTTSSKPRYYLKADFAALFDPGLSVEGLKEAILKWQQANLSKSALARLSLAAYTNREGSAEVLVTFPNQETRPLAPGPSSDISKAVIEQFAPKFLERPVVLWLSTSGQKTPIRDEALAKAIGLQIEADKNLPDIILVDLAPADPLIVFIEVVATDGPISERRQEALYELTDKAGFNRAQVCFVTAYRDRDTQAFKRTVPVLAWNSFAWFVSEPERLMLFKSGVTTLSRLTELRNQ